jgi:hypothetical protein
MVVLKTPEDVRSEMVRTRFVCKVSLAYQYTTMHKKKRDCRSKTKETNSVRRGAGSITVNCSVGVLWCGRIPVCRL